MEKKLKKWFGYVGRPVFPIWIIVLTFIAALATALISKEASKNSFIIGFAFFMAVLLYNLVLILIGIKRNKQ